MTRRMYAKLLGMQGKGRRGLTVMELIVTVSLVAIMLGISLFAMKRGDSKVSTIGLAAAVSDELRAARMLAISNGYPVAIGIPTNGGGNPVASSLYRLEGWNVPRVTWSVGYSGDYPNLGFGACQWSPATGTFTNGVAPPPLSKIAGFVLNDWVPVAHQTDSIFCFTPDGSVITNDLPALDGRYTIVVAKNPTIGGNTITAGEEAAVVYLSANGAVDYSKSTPGTVLSGGSNMARAPIKNYDPPPTGTASVQITEIQVRPDANDPTGTNDAYCIPGQQITFELYAYDPEGRDLFCQWVQDTTLSGGRDGNFTVPRSTQGALTTETERMEWVPVTPAGLNWLGSAGAPQGGCFRARWTWTVPVDSQIGDIYQVQADVKDASGTAQIENRPPAMRLPGTPAGRLLVQILLNGTWQMLRMNPDGSGQQLLTPAGLEELHPSASHDGSKVAFLQRDPATPNNRYVKVRSLTGGGEFVLAGPGLYTSVSMSPNGQWVSYRRDDTNELFIQELADPLPPPAHNITQIWGAQIRPEPLSRTGWSDDDQFAVFGNEHDIERINLQTGVRETIFTSTTYTATSGTYTERVFAPTCFVPQDGVERIIFAFGNNDPVLAIIPYATLGQTGSPPSTTQIDLSGIGGSGGVDDGLPNVSVDGNSLVIPRDTTPLVDNTGQSALIIRWDPGAGNFVYNAGSASQIDQEIKTAVWLP